MSSDESSSSDSTNSTPKLQKKLKKEKKSSSSSNSDDSDSSSDKDQMNHRTSNGKRKRESGSSIIGRSLQKMGQHGNDRSSSSDSDIGSNNKKNNSMTDTSFASPGMSSTRIATKTKKNKTRGKDSGTNEFLKKMMSRFDK